MLLFYRNHNLFFTIKLSIEFYYHLIILNFTNCTINNTETSENTDSNQESIFTERKFALQSESSLKSKTSRNLLEKQTLNTDTNHFYSKNTQPFHVLSDYLHQTDPTRSFNPNLTFNYTGSPQGMNLVPSNGKSFIHEGRQTKEPLKKTFVFNSCINTRVSSLNQNNAQISEHTNDFTKPKESEAEKSELILQDSNNLNFLDANKLINCFQFGNPDNLPKEIDAKNYEFRQIEHPKKGNILSCDHRVNSFNMQYGIKRFFDKNSELNIRESNNMIGSEQILTSECCPQQNVMEKDFFENYVNKSQQKYVANITTNSTIIQRTNPIETNNSSWNCTGKDIMQNRRMNNFYNPQKIDFLTQKTNKCAINISTDSKSSKFTQHSIDKILEKASSESFFKNQDHNNEMRFEECSSNSIYIPEYFRTPKVISNNVFVNKTRTQKNAFSHPLYNRDNIKIIKSQNSTVPVNTGFDKVDGCLLHKDTSQLKDKTSLPEKRVEATNIPSCSIKKNDIPPIEENGSRYNYRQNLDFSKPPFSSNNVQNDNLNGKTAGHDESTQNILNPMIEASNIELSKQGKPVVPFHNFYCPEIEKEKFIKVMDDIFVQENVENLGLIYHLEKNQQFYWHCSMYCKKLYDSIFLQNNVFNKKNFGFESSYNHQIVKPQTVKKYKDSSKNISNFKSNETTSFENGHISPFKETSLPLDYLSQTNQITKKDNERSIINISLPDSSENIIRIIPTVGFSEKHIDDNNIGITSDNTTHRNHKNDRKRFLDNENVNSAKIFLIGTNQNNNILDPFHRKESMNADDARKFKRVKMDFTEEISERTESNKNTKYLRFNEIISQGLRFFNDFVVSVLFKNEEVTYPQILQNSVFEMIEIYDQLEKSNFQKKPNEQRKKFSNSQQDLLKLLMTDLHKYYLKRYIERIFHQLSYLNKTEITMLFEILILSKSLTFEFMREFYCFELVLDKILNKSKDGFNLTDIQRDNMVVFINYFTTFNSELFEYIKSGKNSVEIETKYFNPKKNAIRKLLRNFFLSFKAIETEFELDNYFLSNYIKEETLDHYKFFAYKSLLSKSSNHSKFKATMLISFLHWLQKSDLILLNYGFSRSNCTFEHLVCTFQHPYIDIDTHKLKFVYFFYYLIVDFYHLPSGLTSDNTAYQSAALYLQKSNLKCFMNFKNLTRKIKTTCIYNIAWNKDLTAEILLIYREILDEIWDLANPVFKVFLNLNQ